MRPIVIYDGECDFCHSCVEWVKRRATVEALASQTIKPSNYGISEAQCKQTVVLITDPIYFGAKAVAEILQMTGNRKLARLIIFSGTLGEFGYKFVAEHRSGKLVKLLHFIIKKTT